MSKYRQLAATGIWLAVSFVPLAHAQDHHAVSLLNQFRPIGAGGNNFVNPALTTGGSGVLS
jgi:hypothetical protein